MSGAQVTDGPAGAGYRSTTRISPLRKSLAPLQSYNSAALELYETYQEVLVQHAVHLQRAYRGDPSASVTVFQRCFCRSTSTASAVLLT